MPAKATLQWQDAFVERIYQLCNQVHPGMSIDRDAVGHIKQVVSDVLREILECQKPNPSSVSDLEKTIHSLLPNQAHSIIKDISDFMREWPPKKTNKLAGLNTRALTGLHPKLINLIKEASGSKERMKGEREREVDKMAVFLLGMCDYITEDMLKWAGHYVKNVRTIDTAYNISLKNLQIALHADKELMELIEVTHHVDDEAASSSRLLFDFEVVAEEEKPPPQREKTSYDTVTRELLAYESQNVATLKLLVNVFRRRFETAVAESENDVLDEVFGNVAELQELALQVERCLEDAIQMCDIPSVGPILWPLAEALDFDCYLDYMDNLSTMRAAIPKLLQDPRFQDFFESEEKVYSATTGSQTFRLTVKYVLPELLQLPVVHFYRYIDFLGKLQSLTTSDDDQTDLQNILSYFNHVLAKIDGLVTAEQRKLIHKEKEKRALNESRVLMLEKLSNYQQKFEGYEGKNIASLCTDLVMEGPLQMVRPSLSTTPMETLRILRNGILTERHVFVFDQLIVLCKPRKSSFKYKSKMEMRSVQLIDLDDTDELRYAFRIEAINKQDSSMQVSTLVCKTQADKNNWMTVLLKLQTNSLLNRQLDKFITEEKKRIPLVIPDPEQYIYAEPDAEDNIIFEDYISSSGVPVVKRCTLTKLIERVTYHLHNDNTLTAMFLISYRSFCTPQDLLNLLIERFEVPIPAKLLQQTSEVRSGGPLAGRYDTVQSHGLSPSIPYLSPLINDQSFQRFRKEYEMPIQFRVLYVIHKWIKKHWYDFESDPVLLESLKNFLTRSIEAPGKLPNQYKKFAKMCLIQIEKKTLNISGPLSADFSPRRTVDSEDTPTLSPTSFSASDSFQRKFPEILWHADVKGDISKYDLLTLHPIEIGRQLTLLQFDLYKAIKPVELAGAAWTKSDKQKKSPQLLKFTRHSTLLTYWIIRSVVDSDSLEEVTAMLARTLEIMEIFEKLNNFTGLVALYAALHATPLFRLEWCWDKLQNQHKQARTHFKELCHERWKNVMKQLQKVDPPCIPFFGHYMDNIFKYNEIKDTFPPPQRTSDDGPLSPINKKLISFFSCRRIAKLIGDIQMYQNTPYQLAVEPSIRQFFENIAPCEGFANDDALEEYLYDRSKQILPEKDCKPAHDSKPRHPPEVLKSPGIKQPKSNHYSKGHPKTSFHSANVIPLTPSPRDDNHRSPSFASKHSEDFGLVGITPGQTPQYLGDVSRRVPGPATTSFPLGPVPKKAPPPLHPRRSRTSANGPSASVKSPSSPSPYPKQLKSPMLNLHAQAFIFPDPVAPPPPPPAQRAMKPPAPLPGVATTSEHRVTLPSIGASEPAADGDSPSVSVSLPPPSLPPRMRPGSANAPAPPPRPPKPSHLTPPKHQAPVPPPPLPPKTYKTRRQSSSPTN